jgi:hypothetical protein
MVGLTSAGQGGCLVADEAALPEPRVVPVDPEVEALATEYLRQGHGSLPSAARHSFLADAEPREEPG